MDKGKRLPALLLFSGVALFLFYLASPSSRAANAILRGDYRMLDGDPKLALPEYSRASELVPTAWRPHNRLGRVYDKLSDPKEAWIHHQRALELNPNEPEVVLSASASLVAARRYDEAFRLLQRLLALDPANFEALFMMSEVALARGQARTALLCLRKVVEHNPYHYVAHGRMAVLFAERRPDLALREATLCLESGPPPGWQEVALLLLAQSHLKLGQTAQARAVGERLMREHPNTPQAQAASEILRALD